MQKLLDWFRTTLRQRRWTQNFWGNTTEVVFAGLLFLIGLTSLVWSVVGQVQGWPTYVPFNWPRWITRGTIFGGLMGIGVFRLVRIVFLYSGSDEQRSNFLNQAFDLEYLRPASPATQQYPSIRSRNSRLRVGTRLQFGVECQHPMRLRYWGLACFSLLMVVVSTVNLANAWGDLQYGQLDRLALTLVLLVAMLGLTIWVVWQTGSTLFRQVQIGPTTFELSEHPLRIGGKFEFFVRQTGDIRLDRFQVLLECREEVTYQQGTDVCHSQKLIRSDCVADYRDIDLSQQAFEKQFTVQIPKGVMHSFDAQNNQIAWYAVVTGDHQGCLEFKREFPIIVLPVSSRQADAVRSVPPS